MKILYLHWDEVSGSADQASLQEGVATLATEADMFLRLLELGPEIVAINLDLHPARGRELAHHCHMPLVFIGGSELDVIHAMKRYPDAFFCDALTDVPHEIEAETDQTWSA